MKLYEISDSYKALIEMIENNDGLDEQAIAETVEAIDMAFEDKADNIASLVKSLQAEADAITAERNALMAREKSKKAAADRLKEYLNNNMQKLGKAKIETARNIIFYRKSAAVELKSGFMEWAAKNAGDLLTYKEPEPSKKLIAERLKAGQEIPFAEIVERQNIQIR